MTVAGFPIRVVVVDAAGLPRTALVRTLQSDGTVAVVAEATTPREAAAAVARTRPDVVALALELPGRAERPAALEAIDTIMGDGAVAILVLTGDDEPASTLAVQALAAGAVDVLPRPLVDDDPAGSRLRRRVAVLSRLRMVTRRAAPPARPAGVPRSGSGGPVIAIASSTGGPGALRELLAGLGRVDAPVLLVQHIHTDFTASFAAWLQGEAGLPVELAHAGQVPVHGRVHVAPPDLHLRLVPGPRLELDPEPELLSRPSGDELLGSVAAVAGPAAIGVVLTGMGDDGAKGLLAIRTAGGTTFAQDGASAVVDGMPRAARALGAVGRSLPPRALGAAVADAVRARGGRS